MKIALFMTVGAVLWVGCNPSSREPRVDPTKAPTVQVKADKSAADKDPAGKIPAGEPPAAGPAGQPADAVQGKPVKGSDEASVHKALEEFHAALKQEGIKIDLGKRTLTMPAVVNRPTNDLEFLLIHKQGKSHEALLVTDCKPSILNTGLLALGVKVGKNASFKKKDPMPSEDELRAGADPYILVPPSGGEMFMTVSFQDEAGKKVEVPVEELLLDWTANLSVAETLSRRCL